VARHVRPPGAGAPRPAEEAVDQSALVGAELVEIGRQVDDPAEPGARRELAASGDESS